VKGAIMKTENLIPASWFYMNEKQKTKLNWHLYEYACKLFEHIEECRNILIEKWKSQQSDEQIAQFCAYFSKRTRQNVFSLMEDDEDGALPTEEYISDYYHANSEGENSAILEVTETAMIELLEVCRVCPTRCLDEINAHCDMFDRM